MRETFTVHLTGYSFTTRDVYLEVSATTSISRTLFQLYFSGTKLPDTIMDLKDFDINNHATIVLHLNVQSGEVNSNFAQLSPARLAVRKYAFSMGPEEVRSFFRAESILRFKIPVAHTFGIGVSKKVLVMFQLDTPLSDDPDFYNETFERMSDHGEMQMVRVIKQQLYSIWLPVSDKTAPK